MKDKNNTMIKSVLGVLLCTASVSLAAAPKKLIEDFLKGDKEATIKVDDKGVAIKAGGIDIKVDTPADDQSKKAKGSDETVKKDADILKREKKVVINKKGSLQVVEKKFFKDKKVASLKDMSDGFAAIAEDFLPSVVSITTTQVVDASKGNKKIILPPGLEKHPFFKDFFKDFFGGQGGKKQEKRVQSLGSGFIHKITDEHIYIITNHHVVEDADEVRITFQDGIHVKAKEIGSDKRADSAVLKANRKDYKKADELKPVQWADSANSKTGDWVLAFGNPFGIGTTVTQGIISSAGRHLSMGDNTSDDFIQHTASINQGNSGGPITNIDGKVIGVNRVILSSNGGHIGIGFSIPSRVVQKIVKELMEKGYYSRGWLGVLIQPVTQEMADSLKIDQSGVVVLKIDPKGPAANSDLKIGDVIVSYNGVELSNKNRLTSLVSDTKPNTEVDFKILRKGVEQVIKIKIGESKPADEKAKENAKPKPSPKEKIEKVLSLDVTSVDMAAKKDAGDHKKGLMIMKVDPHSEAANHLKAGDVILEAQYKAVQSVSDLKSVIDAEKGSGKNHIMIKVYRNGQEPPVMYTTLPLQ